MPRIAPAWKFPPIASPRRPSMTVQTPVPSLASCAVAIAAASPRPRLIRLQAMIIPADRMASACTIAARRRGITSNVPMELAKPNQDCVADVKMDEAPLARDAEPLHRLSVAGNLDLAEALRDLARAR